MLSAASAVLWASSRLSRVASIVVLLERENETLLPEHVGRLLGSAAGLLKGTEGRRVVPVINMVDDAAREAQARAAAAAALAATDRFDRVLLLCLAHSGDPRVAVVHR